MRISSARSSKSVTAVAALAGAAAEQHVVELGGTRIYLQVQYRWPLASCW